MNHPNFVILYVENPVSSATFYSDLFGVQPVESAPTFVLFVLESGLKLGLLSTQSAEPAASAQGGGAELVIMLPHAEVLHALYADWIKRGVPILQLPTEKHYGLTFVALDPDNHRLRVLVDAVA